MTPKDLEERAERLRQFNDFGVTAKEVVQFLDDTVKFMREEAVRHSREITALTTALGQALDEMKSASSQLWPHPAPFTTHDVSRELEEAVTRVKRTVKILTENLSESIDDSVNWHGRYTKLAKAVDDVRGGYSCILCNSSNHVTSKHDWK